MQSKDLAIIAAIGVAGVLLWKPVQKLFGGISEAGEGIGSGAGTIAREAGETIQAPADLFQNTVGAVNDVVSNIRKGINTPKSSATTNSGNTGRFGSGNILTDLFGTKNVPPVAALPSGTSPYAAQFIAAAPLLAQMQTLQTGMPTSTAQFLKSSVTTVKTGAPYAPSTSSTNSVTNRATTTTSRCTCCFSCKNTFYRR